MAQLTSTRSSSVALTRKLVEGPLKAPEATDFTAIQTGDFSIAANFETVENLELLNDIMVGQPTISGESPTGSMSHYWKGSGTEGEDPEFSILLESSFGQKKTAKAGLAAAASSTTSVIKVASGHGLSKGDAVLVKHSAHEHEIRPIKSVTATELNLGFDLNQAPAASTSLGRCVTYSPSSIDLPVFDCWHYMGDGKAGLETIKDCRTVSATITAAAKDNINCSYSFEGTAYSLNDPDHAAYEVVSGKNTFVLIYGKASDTSNYPTESVTLDAGFYTAAGLAEELQKKLVAISQAGYDFTGLRVTYSKTDKKFSIQPLANDNTVVSKVGVKMTTSTRTSAELAAFLGFSEGADKEVGSSATGGDAAVSDVETVPSNYIKGVTPSFDSSPPIIARKQQLFLGANSSDNVCLETSSVTVTIGTPKTLLTSICPESGNFATVINSRTATVSLAAFYESNDQRFFRSFKEGSKTSFALVGGARAADNYVAGNSYSIYGSEATITSMAITGSDDVYTIELELACFSPGDGSGSIFCSFL